MRRALVAAIAAPALVLAGCSGDEPSAPGTTAPGGASDGTDGTDGTTEGADGADQTATDAPAEDEDVTTTGDAAGVEGGEDGQAAADVAAAFLVALANAEPEACDHLLSFTDIERPMTAVQSDYEMCAELLPEVISAQAEAQGLSDEAAAALEGLVIRGADVDGDTAVVDADNYPPDLAASMGDLTVTLKRVDDQWYVDLDKALAVPTSR